MRNTLLKGLALGLLLTTSARSATNIIDFNTNPTNSGLYALFGNVVGTNNLPAPWRPTGGASGGANDGYLAITDASGGSQSTLVFKDLENGLVLKAFTFECDIRIGGGTAVPADGFSINLASANDPIVIAAANNQSPLGLYAGTVNGPAPSVLAEEGTQTGLAVGFDAWTSGAVTPTVQDVMGLSIRVDGTIIAQLPTPLAAGNVYYPSAPLPGSQGTNYTYDATDPLGNGSAAPTQNVATNAANYLGSLQTGARNTTDDLNGDGSVTAADPGTPQTKYGAANYDLWMKNLRYEHFIMELTEAPSVKISWKGVEITPPGGIPIATFEPRAGRLVLGGRTGGAWQVSQVDNIRLVTVPFDSVYVSSFFRNASGFTAILTDQGTAVLDQSTVTATLNGASITPLLTLTKPAGSTNTYATYAASPLLAVGSSNTVVLTYRDTFGIQSTARRVFVVGPYTTLPASFAATGVDTSALGFSARLHQIRVPRSPGDGNTIANAERHIAGGFIDPTTGLAYTNTLIPGTSAPSPDDPDGIHYNLDVINWNEFGSQAGCGSSNDIGDFQLTFSYPQDVRDTEIPGLYGCIDTPNPDAGGYNDNMVAEVIAYLDLPAGYYTFGVNSDDGFKVSASPAIGGDVLGLTLGSFNGGRGASDTLFDVYVPTGGIYPVRLLWWEGGGGANCEFFYVDPTTSRKILINDGSQVAHYGGGVGSGAIKAYKGTATASATRPYVSRVTPEAGKPEAANTGNGARSGQLFVFADQDVSAWITDGTITVNPSSVSLIVNGTTYTGATKSGSVTTVSRPGSLASLLPGGSNYAAVVYSYTDGGSTVTSTNSWMFTVVPYAVIPAANAVSANSLTLADTGFKAFVNQIDRSGDTNQANGNRITGGSDENRMPWPEVELFSGNINPTNGTAYPNLALPGPNGNWTYDMTSINFNSNPANGATGVIVGDGSMPGMPGNGTSVTDNIRGIQSVAAEYRTYLNLAAGAYLFAVNSDDGFVCTSGPDPHDTLGTLLGFANFGRGNSSPLPNPPTTKPVPTPASNNGNSTFQVIVPQAGYYPFRILFWQGGGGINMEFLSIDKASGLQDQRTPRRWFTVAPPIRGRSSCRPTRT